jgi:uncharacterized membrane protein YebE (DUF533 family)
MSLMHKHKEAVEKKTQEAAEARGAAKAYTAIGAVGGSIWVTGEILGPEGVLMLTQLAESAENKVLKRVVFGAGLVAIGALIYAGIKHHHAHKAEQEKQTLQSQMDWQEKVQASQLPAAGLSIS